MRAKNRLVLSSVVIFLLGSAFHFLYKLLGNSPVAAVLFAVNESVWEHMKLLSTAALLWMVVDWRISGIESRTRFFQARALSLPLSLLLIPAAYYLFKEAFQLENVILSIAILAASSFLYQWLAQRLERSLLASRNRRVLAILALTAIFLLFSAFTFYPPHLPLFLDTSTGTYGPG